MQKFPAVMSQTENLDNPVKEQSYALARQADQVLITSV
jgi:hypothetical protein